MTSRSAVSKTPTGRKTPLSSFSHIRPPSPKVDHTPSKSKLAPSPKPKSDAFRAKGKSPSNVEARKALLHENSFTGSHRFDEDSELISVRSNSVFDDVQLAKIKEVVDMTRHPVVSRNLSRNMSEEVESGEHLRNFHGAPNRSRSEHDKELLYSDVVGGYIEQPTPRPVVVAVSSDDCGVSDITTDAPYMMTTPAKRTTAPAEVDVASVDNFSNMSNEMLEMLARKVHEEMAKRNKAAVAEPTTPVAAAAAAAATAAATQAPAPANNTSNSHNQVFSEAANARKGVVRGGSAGNERMMKRPVSLTQAQVPSYGIFKQKIDEFHQEARPVSVEPSELTPSKSIDLVDGEIESVLREIARVQSVTPPVSVASSASSLGGHHPAAGVSTAARVALSPAGVTNSVSRGTSISRGSGTYLAFERMCPEASTLPSPLLYVESPTHAPGGMFAPANSLSAAPINSSRPAPRINNLMDPFEDPAPSSNRNSLRVSGGSSKSAKNQSFREAKSYSETHPFEVEVALVEEFAPVTTFQEHKVTPAAAPVRPTITRNSSVTSTGSDMSAEQVAANADLKKSDIAKQFDAFLQRDTAEIRSNRDLLVSPLCAFDDCASMESGWSLKSGGSRRSTASNKHAKSHHKTDKHSTLKNSMHYQSVTSSYLAKHQPR